jgi:lysophospholipase L1-like esterase
VGPIFHGIWEYSGSGAGTGFNWILLTLAVIIPIRKGATGGRAQAGGPAPEVQLPSDSICCLSIARCYGPMIRNLFLLLAFVAAANGQTAPAPQNWTAADDHHNMMEQVGVKALRPGPSGNEAAPNHANYDESTANPFPDYPEILRLKDGRAVTTPEMWWNQRRPEIVEDFDREVLGRVPANAPKITWSVKSTVNDHVGPYPVVARELVGHADNSGYPGITVDIQMVVVTPAWAEKPVPLMMMFGRAALPSTPLPAAFARFAALAGTDPPAAWQLIGAGWGYALLDPGSVQADNGAGLTKGIIGLTNKGQPRKPDDWGALRAWGWGASRALDYLETDRTVDAKHVGIEGVSRYGKAALVTMAYDRRFAIVLVGSSGEGGAKPHRRNFGEAVENLTGSGEYHWMAGNFLKYGAAEASFGSKTAGDIPVDSHELIALCAPRFTFISYGVPEKGDAKWLDQQGSFMATVAAGAVFRLLGAKDIGVAGDYRTAKMPPVNTGLLDGTLAWRQHDGGHTDGPNWKYFIPWAARSIGYTAPPVPPIPADVPVPRTDANSLVAHARLIEKAKKGGIDIYFEGDSITRRWGATDYPQLLENWKRNFTGWNAADFGWGADRIQNILWRVNNGELDGVNPKIVVLLAGTNNIGNSIPAGNGDALAADITKGMQALVAAIRGKAPDATVIVTGIFPRNDNMAAVPVINEINGNLAKMADGGKVRYLGINDKLADAHGTLFDGMMNPDKLHPAEKAYQVWADALKPTFRELLGAPGAEDHAPPPTGDPSAKR